MSSLSLSLSLSLSPSLSLTLSPSVSLLCHIALLPPLTLPQLIPHPSLPLTSRRGDYGPLSQDDIRLSYTAFIGTLRLENKFFTSLPSREREVVWGEFIPSLLSLSLSFENDVVAQRQFSDSRSWEIDRKSTQLMKEACQLWERESERQSEQEGKERERESGGKQLILDSFHTSCNKNPLTADSTSLSLHPSSVHIAAFLAGCIIVNQSAASKYLNDTVTVLQDPQSDSLTTLEHVLVSGHILRLGTTPDVDVTSLFNALVSVVVDESPSFANSDSDEESKNAIRLAACLSLGRGLCGREEKGNNRESDGIFSRVLSLVESHTQSLSLSSVSAMQIEEKDGEREEKEREREAHGNNFHLHSSFSVDQLRLSERDTQHASTALFHSLRFIYEYISNHNHLSLSRIPRRGGSDEGERDIESNTFSSILSLLLSTCAHSHPKIRHIAVDTLSKCILLNSSLTLSPILSALSPDNNETSPLLISSLFASLRHFLASASPPTDDRSSNSLRDVSILTEMTVNNSLSSLVEITTFAVHHLGKSDTNTRTAIALYLNTAAQCAPLSLSPPLSSSLSSLVVLSPSLSQRDEKEVVSVSFGPITKQIDTGVPFRKALFDLLTSLSLHLSLSHSHLLSLLQTCTNGCQDTDYDVRCLSHSLSLLLASMQRFDTGNTNESGAERGRERDELVKLGTALHNNIHERKPDKAREDLKAAHQSMVASAEKCKSSLVSLIPSLSSLPPFQ